MCEFLNDFLLEKSQYLINRELNRVNYQESSFIIPIVDNSQFTPNYQGLFSKAFGHTGPSMMPVNQPDQSIYSIFINAIYNKDKLQVYNTNNTRKGLVDTYCIFDTNLFGVYKSTFSIPTAPTYESEKSGAELCELYAISLLRDTQAYLFDSVFPYPNPTAQNYIENILSYLNINNIKNNLDAPLQLGNITKETFFRGNTTGDLIGPYVSQFFYYPNYYGVFIYNQIYSTYANTQLNTFDQTTFWSKYPNSSFTFLNDFMKTESNFVNIWNGNPTLETFDPSGIDPSKYISTFRDMGMYIYRDQVWQPFYTVATILLNSPNNSSFGVPIGFHYGNRLGTKFINLGPHDLYSLLAKCLKLVMDSTWLWKWSQLKLRPEEMAYQVHLQKKYGIGIPVNNNLMNNPVLVDISNNNNGNYLLPQIYRVGSPAHPSYPSGHACIAGAMSTILKAWFNCDSSMNVYISKGASTLEYYIDGSYQLNIGNELDKFASNCGIFRNVAGIHYRSDAYGGLEIGEKVAISLLKDWTQKYYSDVIFRFKLRNGTPWEISKNFSRPYLGPIQNLYSSTPVTINNPFFASGTNISPTPTPSMIFFNQNLS
jgi:hypothetical protein